MLGRIRISTEESHNTQERPKVKSPMIVGPRNKRPFALITGLSMRGRNTRKSRRSNRSMTKEQANTKRRADEELGTYCTVLLLAILGLGIPGRATAQDSPPPVGPSLTQLAAEMRQRYGPVRFHREEDLEDQLVVRPTIETISALNTRI